MNDPLRVEEAVLMAATTGQGRSFTTFIVGLTGLCAGIAYFSTGVGKFIAGAGGMKLMGAFVSALGWVLILAGLHVVTGTIGRIVLGLVGIGVSLFGILYILPAAFNKNAIWKS